MQTKKNLWRLVALSSIAALARMAVAGPDRAERRWARSISRNQGTVTIAIPDFKGGGAAVR